MSHWIYCQFLTLFKSDVNAPVQNLSNSNEVKSDCSGTHRYLKPVKFYKQSCIILRYDRKLQDASVLWRNKGDLERRYAYCA